MKKRIVTLLMVAVLTLSTTTVLAAPSVSVNNSVTVNNSVSVDNTVKPETDGTVPSTPETDTTVPSTPSAPVVEAKKEAASLTQAEVKVVMEALAKVDLATEEGVKEAREVFADIPTANFATTMKEDKAVLSKVVEVESAYTDKLNIQVKPNRTGNAAFAITDLGVVGAGLNATEKNSEVVLTVGDVAELVAVPAAYENAFQIDINLSINGVSKSELDVPVAITTNVPNEMSTENLVVLHYHDNTVTEIIPVVEGDKVTFAVDSFSTFVFANKTVEADASYLYYLIANPYGTAGTGVVTAPKTGETVSAVSVMAVMSMVAAVVVITRRKVTVK